jgi:hypothetical protein
VRAGLGRRRLHHRVRHPALLPPRQAAPPDGCRGPTSVSYCGRRLRAEV